MNLENIEKRLQIAITSLKTKINIAFENFSTVDGRIYHPPFVPEDKRILGGVQVVRFTNFSRVLNKKSCDHFSDPTSYTSWWW